MVDLTVRLLRVFEEGFEIVPFCYISFDKGEICMFERHEIEVTRHDGSPDVEEFDCS